LRIGYNLFDPQKNTSRILQDVHPAGAQDIDLWLRLSMLAKSQEQIVECPGKKKGEGLQSRSG
jgi:hypothetical protein